MSQSATQNGSGSGSGRSTPMAAVWAAEEFFGFETLGEGQRATLASILAGRDTLSVLPTGAGKSACYQIPALLKSGLTVVISPMISLMEDQIRSLRQARIDGVEALHSGQSPAERAEITDRMLKGSLNMLYVSPERLRSMEFVLKLRSAANGICLIAVDEAHCISEWGHDFRPDYRQMAAVITNLGRPPVLALTATATPRVRADICGSLGLDEPEVVVTSAERAEIHYSVRTLDRPEQKPSAIKELLGLRTSEKEVGAVAWARAQQLSAAEEEPPDEGPTTPAIVYAATRAATEEIAAELSGEGLAAEAYHAGLSSGQRSTVAANFMADETEVVVATVAFGMGVNKRDVRLVVHADAPPSMESYLQESGRAGRDGAPARAVMLFEPRQMERRKALAASADPAAAARQIQGALAALDDAADEDGSLRLAPSKVEDLAAAPDIPSRQVLSLLEEAGAIHRGYDLWQRIEVDAVHDALSEGPSSDLASSERWSSHCAAVEAIFATVPAEGELMLSEAAAAAGVSPALAQAVLARMIADGAIEAVPKAATTDIRVLAAEMDAKMSASVERKLSQRSDEALSKLSCVEEYTAAGICRRRYLLEAFGEEPQGSCSGCDSCDRAGASLRDEGVHGQPNPAHGEDRAKEEPDGYGARLHALKSWRAGRAAADGLPPYMILSNDQLRAVAERKPASAAQVAATSGIGARRAGRYGQQILDAIHGPRQQTADG